MIVSVRRTWRSLAAVAMVLPLATVPPAARAADDGPGVARLSLLSGPVAIARGDAKAPVAAVLNAPLLAADYVTTGEGGRAEIELDAASAVRVSGATQLRFAHLDPGDRDVQLAQGTIGVRVRDGAAALTVDTPSISIRPSLAGTYRVTVTADGTTDVTVRSGRAEIATPAGTQQLDRGATLIATGSAADPKIDRAAAIALDDFDAFDRARDAHEERAPADAGYANPDVPGVEDLSGYGRWVSDDSYGTVWSPYNVAPGWAPYRFGRWGWEDGYGWTWLSSEPWGWAPYHYGSWYRSSAYGWCWYPPAVGLAPIWRPAVVGFFGFGGDGFGLGWGNIGWVPLAPFETYVPWWGPHWNGGYAAVTNVTNVYNNITYNGATTVTQAQFQAGRFDHPLPLGPSQLRHLSAVRGVPPVVPAAAHLRFTASGDAGLPPAPIHRSFAGGSAAVVRVPFERQRELVARALGVPRPVAAPPAAAATSIRRPAAGATVASPWDRFESDTTTRAAAVPSRGTPAVVHDLGARAAHARDPWPAFGRIRGAVTAEPAASPRRVRAAAPPAASVAGRAVDRTGSSSESPEREPLTIRSGAVRAAEPSIRTGSTGRAVEVPAAHAPAVLRSSGGPGPWR